MTARGPLMFHELAPYYDRLLEGKDYRSEVRRLEELARRYCRSGGDSWLDVACGTGRHLELLRRNYSVAGVDRSLPMLRIARQRLPDVRLMRGDMRSFDLGQSFDIVSCLFGAIGHLSSEGEVQAAFTSFARHLRPGGLAIVEPWIDPTEFRPGFLHLMRHEGASLALVRLSYSERRANRMRLRVHYLVGQRSQGLRHLEEGDTTLMVPRARLLALLQRAGLQPRYLARGLRRGRGLVVAMKPTDASRIPPRAHG